MKNANFLARKKRILVVDDDKICKSILKSYIQKLGHEVITADNGYEAVELVKMNRFDLVTMDVNMPIVDGINATRSIRRLKGDKNLVPIIGVTDNQDQDVQMECYLAGMNQILKKPARFEDIESILLD